MKKVSIFLIFTVIWAPIAIAGGYYGSQGLDRYSNDGDIYYRSINFREGGGGFLSGKSSTSWVMNLQVFDLKSGKSWKIFEDDFSKEFSITELIFESTTEENGIRRLRGGRRLKNVTQKDLKEKILIVVRNSKTNTEALWTANKFGKELFQVATVGKNQDWHIDVKNEKIRVFTKERNQYQMKEYPW